MSASLPPADQPALRRLADFATTLDVARLPQPVLARLHTAVVDVIWGCLHVHHDARAAAALRSIPLDRADARASVLTTRHRAFAADAAFVNALACAATDRSDTHLPTATHPGIIIVPAVLAALQERGGGTDDLLRGVVAGYEIMGRLARVLMAAPNFAATYRPTAVAAPVAAAIAVAAALRLSPDAATRAGSLAANTAIGLNEWARAGTGEHVFHAGTAARNAVTSAYLAADGFEAADSALDGTSGLFSAYGVRERLPDWLDDLGSRFEMLQIAFKPAPACFFAQTPAQTAARIGRPVESWEVDNVEIKVTATAAGYPGCAANADIATFQAAVMSIPFAVAATLRAGALDELAWRRFDDPETVALTRRCFVSADPELTSAYPGRSGCAITVHLASGQRLEARQDDFISMDHDGVCIRFAKDGERLIGAQPVRDIIQAVEGLATSTDFPRRLANEMAQLARTGQ